MTPRPDGAFGRFVADVANQYILPTFTVFLENQIWMVCYLSHLHDQTEDVGVIVKHDTTANIGIELSIGVGHDTGREVTFDFAKELVVYNDTIQHRYELPFPHSNAPEG
jgi:hypothetical protein